MNQLKQVTEKIEKDIKSKTKKRNHHQMIHDHQQSQDGDQTPESQVMKEDGSMTDDVQSLGPSKRLKIDKLSFYTIEDEMADAGSVLSKNQKSQQKKSGKHQAMGSRFDTTAADKKYYAETFDSVNEWEDECDSKMQVDQESLFSCAKKRKVASGQQQLFSEQKSPTKDQSQQNHQKQLIKQKKELLKKQLDLFKRQLNQASSGPLRLPCNPDTNSQ